MSSPVAESDNANNQAAVHDHDILGDAKEPRGSEERAQVVGLTDTELALEKKLRWKIDLMIMPLIVWTYLMNYIDR